jgi:hypothetical protein
MLVWKRTPTSTAAVSFADVIVVPAVDGKSFTGGCETAAEGEMSAGPTRSSAAASMVTAARRPMRKEFGECFTACSPLRIDNAHDR